MLDASGQNQRPLRPRVFVILGVALAATFYLMINYVGPFKWLAELQLRWWGTYEEQITFLITYALLALPLGAIDWVIRKALPSTSEYSGAPKWIVSLAKFEFAGILALVGVIFLSLAGWQWFKGRDTLMARVSASVFEEGQAPAQRWAAVQGVVHFDDAVVIKESGNPRYFVPVTSEQWKPRSPVALYLEARNEQLDEIHRASRFHAFEGMLSREGLPGLARSGFEQRGEPPASGYYLLELHKTPADLRRLARDLSIFGGLMVAAGVVILVIQQRRAQPARAVSTTPDPRFEIKMIRGIPSQAPPDDDAAQ